jgi:hypothetical protein
LECEIDQFVAEAHDWFDSLINLWTAPLQCLTSLTVAPATTWRSPDFAPVAPPTAPCQLVLNADLVPYWPVPQAPSLSRSLVRLVPSSLDAQNSKFYLEVNVADVGTLPAGVYYGQVNVTGSANITAGANIAGGGVPINVWIAIP